MVAVAFVLISLEIKGADWGMMGGLLETQTYATDVALISLSNDWVERFFDVGTDGSCICDGLRHVGDLLGDVLFLCGEVEIVRKEAVDLSEFLQKRFVFKYLYRQGHVHNVLTGHYV